MTPQTPERCGQRLSPPNTGEEYRCTLAAAHSGEFHRSDDGSTWSRAGNLLRAEEPAVPADGACGASLVFSPTGRAYSCGLPMGHANTSHHDGKEDAHWAAADPARTVMDAHTARQYRELLALAAPGEDGALNLGPIIARYNTGQVGSLDDVLPLMREVMRLRREARDSAARNPHADPVPAIRDLSEMLRIFVDTRCTGCPIVANSSNPEDGADIEPRPDCPVHGEVAELRRSLDWSARQYERIALALGPEYAGPFAPDVAAPAIECIKTARGIDAVLREAGTASPLGLAGVEDLASQREGALEHVRELRATIRRALFATVHQGHSAELDECPHVTCAMFVEALKA